MGGYYQNAVMLQRDLLEVSFLLDYFRSNRDRIAEWRGYTESARNKNFRAFKIRTALDDRDGFTERKRAEHYARLCTLGCACNHIRAFNCCSRTRADTRTVGRTFPSARLTRLWPNWRKSA
jgi:hypothetical protein